MSLTGNEDHSISLTTASEWTANYRATISSGDPLGNYFGQAAIAAILAQEDCIGIRIYYALDGVGDKKLIITGVDEDGNDLYEGELAEKAVENPPFGAASNPLNS